jgi:hypothetical protein
MQKIFVEIYKQLNEVNENIVEPARRLTEIANQGQVRLVQQHLGLVEKCLNMTARQLRSLAESTDVQELVSRQAELAAQWNAEIDSLARRLLKQRDQDDTTGASDGQGEQPLKSMQL